MVTSTHIRERRPRRQIAAAVLAAGVLAACGGTASDEAATTDGSPVSGGTLSVGIPYDEGCSDPQQVRGRTILMIGRAVVDSLVFQRPDTGGFEPWLAESWQIDPKATTYTFRLRKGVTFSDGSAFNAEAVKANFDAIVAMGGESPLGSSYLKGYRGTTVVDELTARVTFAAPNAPFLQAVSTPTLGMLSAKSAQGTPQLRCQGNLVGTGPFALTRYKLDEGLTLERRTGYAWAPVGATNKGDAYLDKIELDVVPEPGVRTGSLVSGQLDLTMEITKADVAPIEGAGLPIEVRPNPGLPQQFFVNTGRPVLRDRAVRQALLVGLDRELLVSTALTKYQPVATSALSSTTPGFVKNDGLLKFDPEGAKKLLDEAGWMVGSDGIRQKNGTRLSVSVLYGTPQYSFLIPLMELAQQQYKQIGIDVKLRPLPVAESIQAEFRNDFDLRISGLTRSDPDALRAGFAGRSDALDKLLNEQAATAATDKRMAVVAEAQKVALDEAVSIPINELSLPFARQKAVQGVRFSADSLLLLHELWHVG